MFGGIRTIARGESKIDFVGRTKLWLIISGVLMLASIGGLVFRGLNLGLSFKGGTSLRSPLRTSAAVADFRNALSPLGLSDVEIQFQTDTVSHEREVLIQTKHLEPIHQLPDVEAKIVGVAGLASPDEINVEDVGPKWGKQISNKALQGLIAFLVLVIAYISLRFEPKMAAAAVIALFHDLLATAGVYALIGFQVTPATVVALLTILGYSLYDTVVVFDKVRENAATVGGPNRVTYSDMVNRSVNQVLMRSINTSLTSLIPVGALLLVGAGLVGAEQLKDLALALLIGILVGTYSSVFVASPILAVWKEREPRYSAIRTRQAKSPVRGPAMATSAGPVAAGVEFTPSQPATPNGPSRPITARPPVSARARKKKRGKRRR